MRHQVGEFGALPVLRAIDAFAQAEERRWAQLRAGTLPPIQLSPEEQLDELIPQGYRLIQAQQTAAACDVWLAAWDLVKQLIRPELRSPAELNEIYGLTYSVAAGLGEELLVEAHQSPRQRTWASVVATTHRPDDLPGIVERERPDRQPGERNGAAQGRQPVAEGRCGGQLIAAQRADQQHWQAQLGLALRHVLHHIAGGDVGPLEIVQEQDEGRTRG